MKLLQFLINIAFVGFWCAVFYTYGANLVSVGCLVFLLLIFGGIATTLKVANNILECELQLLQTTTANLKTSSTVLEVTLEMSKLWLAYLKPSDKT